MSKYIILERDILRFQKRLMRNKETGCLEFTGYLNREGYGRIHIHESDGSNTTIRTHRLAWIIANGDIPDKMCVCHHCNNRKCCNPDHLFLGTIQDNNADCRDKGRATIDIGERHWQNKLSEKEVLEIRACHQEGKLSQLQLARLFGVDNSSISLIVNNKTWKHLIAVNSNS